jgi:hypothetical protein
MSANEAPSRRAMLFRVLPAAAAAVAGSAAVGLPTAPSSVEPATPSTPHPDADLFKLIDRYRAAKVEDDAASAEFGKFEGKWYERQRDHLKRLPEALRERPGDREIFAHTGFKPNVDGFYDININPADHPAAGEHWLGSVDEIRGPLWTATKATGWGPDSAGGLDKGGEATIKMWKFRPLPEARGRADEIIMARDRLAKRRRPPGYRKAERIEIAARNKRYALFDEIEGTRAKTVEGMMAKVQLAKADSWEDEIGHSLIDDIGALRTAAAAG